MLPPGLGFVALSERAQRKAEKGANKNFYFDLRKYQKSIGDGDTPFTPANTLIQAQAVSRVRFQVVSIVSSFPIRRLTRSASISVFAGVNGVSPSVMLFRYFFRSR
jgi:hypothetical protein